MKSMTRQSLNLAVGFVLATGMGAAVADMPAAGEACVACHSESGASDDASIPNIGGVGSFFLENQFAIFGEEARPCAADAFADVDAENHCAIVQGLSEDDKMALAEYYGEQEYAPFEQEVDPALADMGESIHADSCDRCHTEAGTEPFDDAGILAGQPKAYLISQFKTYKAAERWQPESMAEAMDLSEDQMKQLAEYYAAEGMTRFE